MVAFLFRSMLYFYHNHILTERKSIYMGKKISVYWSTILVTIPIILAVFFVMIFITYNYVYNITYNNSIDHIKKAAELTDEGLADYDRHDKADAEEAIPAPVGKLFSLMISTFPGASFSHFLW